MTGAELDEQGFKAQSHALDVARYVCGRLITFLACVTTYAAGYYVGRHDISPINWAAVPPSMSLAIVLIRAGDAVRGQDRRLSELIGRSKDVGFVSTHHTGGMRKKNRNSNDLSS